MSVDQDTVLRIAKLARIAITEDQAKAMQGDLNGILDWVEKLNAVTIDDVPPLTSTVAMGLKRREDAVTDGGDAARVTGNAPGGEDGFFTVPKVVE
ncbi:MAG: Asp-tRNA(Asn)/Glu-tRNA(Gln) amidotransferase subunit GatC [Alphaproteobacteria bacterium]